jgi:hypothetical protein
MSGRGKESALLLAAREAGIQLSDTNIAYKDAKEYRPLDESHLTLREFTRLAGLNYRSTLSSVTKAALCGCWELLPPEIALYLEKFEAEFEVYKGRGAGKIEFRVRVRSNKAENLLKIGMVVAERPKKTRFVKLWVYETTKQELEDMALSSGVSVACLMQDLVKKSSLGHEQK